jgi:molecular chaperone DnaK
MTKKISKIVGIDLGTTYSAIAILDDLGNPEVLPSIDNNSRITPSVVYFANNNKAIVGEKAKDAIINEKKKVAREIKREMENDVVFDVSQGAWVKSDKKKEGTYTPSQVSSLILSKLKEYTDNIDKVVITVPAMFAEKARSATMDAAKLAGLEVLELINEPTAAILHYSKIPGVNLNGRVMVYDLGGGTFDVTIANVKGTVINIITSRGDKYLGGGDFDREIVNILNKKYKKQKGAELDLNEKKYQEIAEKIKKVLSLKEETSEVIDGPKGPIKIEITRSEFEKSIQSYIEKTKMLIEEALDDAKCKANQITQTLLVGGSTRVPIVIESLTKIMGKPPIKGVNVDEAVACGAAIHAGLLRKKDLNSNQKKSLDKVELNDVCNYYLGTLVVVTDQQRNLRALANSIIIPRNTKLPCSKTERYTTISDNQEGIDCSVTQSENPEEDKDFVNIIYQGELDLPKGRPAGQPVDVTYSYDQSGVIHVEFLDVNSKKKHEADLRPEGSKSIEDLKDELDFKIE